MVNPKIWGDCAWKFLISVIADYPDNPGIDMQHHFKRFFFHLRWVLPCEFCRNNYEHHFRKWPIDQYLKSRPALYRWLANVYNETRASLGKPPLSDQEIIFKYFGDCDKGVPEEMIALLCSGRDPEWQGLEQEGGAPRGQTGGTFAVLGNLQQWLDQSLGVTNTGLFLTFLLLVGVYVYLFTRRRA